MNITWGDIEANCKNAARLIDSAPGSDIYVLPEMWSTGFATKPECVADDSLRSLSWMSDKAKETNAAIVGSVATKCNDGTHRNRLYFVKPDGDVSFYDKHHLFTYGNEHQHYKAGKERVVVEWKGVRFLLQICYDLRFPCFSRNKGEYDCAIYVASWPSSRIQSWLTLLQARAIENQCYVIGVNRIGSDPSCNYCGGTEIINPYGRIDCVATENTEIAITSNLDIEALNAFRKKFPVLNDAD